MLDPVDEYDVQQLIKFKRKNLKCILDGEDEKKCLKNGEPNSNH